MVNSAIGGSTNAPIHLTAIARHAGVPLEIEDFYRIGFHVPCIVDLQPTGRFLGEDFHRAGGVPAVVLENKSHGLINEKAITANGLSIGDNCRDRHSSDRAVIRQLRGAARGRRRFSHSSRQFVRQCGHEDERHQRGVPPALPI